METARGRANRAAVISLRSNFAGSGEMSGDAWQEMGKCFAAGRGAWDLR